MISHLKRRFGIFAALAVLTSVCAAVSVVTVSPVSAAPATTAITALTIDDVADYSACPASASIPSAGFTDTTDSAVDCLAYYGITLGTTATTYEPTASVSRWQMALYITRAHTEAGGTLGTGADQGFTDISGKSAEIQTAINQIKQLGVTVGKTATTFAPDDNVTREEMALFIERWLETTTAGPGGTSEADADVALAAASVTYINNDCDSGASTAMTCSGLYNYTDIDSGSVTVEGSLAIKELFTMGIHDGASATTFSPASDMTRAAMATFMTAALAHTNLRPEGLHVQASAASAVGNNSATLHVSYRDASFDPIVAAPIDMFYWTDTLGAEGQGSWTSTGLCNASYITTEASSLTECYIDTGDPKTDDSGNIAPANASATAVSYLYAGGQTHYAWTDAVATTFDNDTKGSGNKFASVVVSSSPAADELSCSHDVNANALAATAVHTTHFDAVTTVTCQFYSGATQAALGIAVPESGKYATLTNVRTFTQDSSTLQSGDVTESYSTIAVSSATGAFSWTITGPSDTTGNDSYTDVIQITRSTGGAGIGNATTASYSGHMAEGACGAAGASDASICFGIIYDDDAAAGNSVGMTQATSSALASSTGITRTNTATAYDQYGDPTAGIAITFTSASSLPEALVCDTHNTATCTSLTAHGLTEGDLLTVTTPLGLFAQEVGGVVAAATVLCVGTVATTTTFLLEAADCSTAIDSAGGDGAAGTAARPLYVTEPSFLPTLNSRTTGSAGTATFSWVDTITHATADIVTATTAGSKTTTKTFYRLTTSADFISNTASIGVKGANETCAALVEFDAVGQDYILRIDSGATASASGGQTTSVHKQYTYDANDQFSDTATVANKDGVPDTMATWVVEMATLAATAGTCDDVMEVDMSATPVASIQRHSKQG